MVSAVGNLLRALALVLTGAVLLGLPPWPFKHNPVTVQAIGLCLALATFRFGTWLTKPDKVHHLVERATSLWWSVEYGFRLSVFLGVAWVIGYFFMQADASFEWSLLVLPPFGFVAAYLGHRHFILGSTEQAHPKQMHVDTTPRRSDVEEGGHVEPEVGVENPRFSGMTSKERERAMDQLIERMR